jgi:hypothetical protein
VPGDPDTAAGSGGRFWVKGSRRQSRWRVVVAVMAVSAGCGGNGPGSGAEGPLDREITAAIGAFWDGTGVPDDVPIMFDYDHQTHRSTRSCQHLPEDDRWYAERTSLIEPGKVAQAPMSDATLTYLEREGFTVTRWRTTATAAPVAFGFIGHKGDTAIEVDVSDDGRTDLAVRMGPCATQTLDGFSEPLYERIE